MDDRFDTWCEKPWRVFCDWAVVPCPVHVSPSCQVQVLAAFPNGDGPDFVRIAARYHADLDFHYLTGQTPHVLAEPLQGVWHILWHLGMLYVDTEPHPVPVRERKMVGDH